MFYGARVLNEIVNLLYYEALAFIAYQWVLYVIVKLKIFRINTQKVYLLFSIPLLIFTVIALVNPFTQILFTIDEQNLYVRTSGVWIHWIVTWGYLMVSTFLTVRALRKASDKLSRHEILPLLYFIVAPIIASITQMLFYGVTATQVGITLSIILILADDQSNQILMDSMTRMNNRKGLYRFFADHILGKSQTDVTLVMLDLNNFKTINDTYGHLVGDKALIDASEAIRQACHISKENYFLCRYGGDEFLIAAIDSDSEQIEQLILTIYTELKQHNRNGNLYDLEFSVGRASGICTNVYDFEQLLNHADALMYENKQKSKEKCLNKQ